MPVGVKSKSECLLVSEEIPGKKSLFRVTHAYKLQHYTGVPPTQYMIPEKRVKIGPHNNRKHLEYD